MNDSTVTDDKMTPSAKDLTPEGVVKLSLGKKRHVLLKPASRAAVAQSEHPTTDRQFCKKIAFRPRQAAILCSRSWGHLPCAGFGDEA